MSAYSVVEWHDGHEGYRCGYCKSPNTNYSHGMSAYKLTVNDYQDLIDRGWRRSGTYVYKPTMKKTCCPQYTIRCDACAFNLSRSHKKVIKRVNKYLNFGTIPDKNEHSDEVSHPSASDYPQGDFDTANVNVESGNEVPKLATVDRKLLPEAMENASVAAIAAVPNSAVGTVKHHQPKPGIGADPTKPKCMKAKLQRLEKKRLKAEAVVPTTDTVQTDCLNKTKVKEKKSLEDHLGDVIDTPVHKLEIQLVRSSPASEEFNIMYDESYALFKKYQIAIHKDDENECSESMFEGFLVESPLQANDEVLPHGFGSFHQHYILDGKIIAVGVLDILPKCVSSVYFYYDPDYSFLSLGTYSALRELALSRELHRICPDISYYYMGFYIYSCPKMRYKGQYDPSYLLCPEIYSWHKIDECRKKLDVHKYSRFAEAGIDDKDSDVELNNVLVLHQRQVMSYEAYRSKKSRVTDKKSVSLYAHLVGNALTKRILLYRS